MNGAQKKGRRWGREQFQAAHQCPDAKDTKDLAADSFLIPQPGRPVRLLRLGLMNLILYLVAARSQLEGATSEEAGPQRGAGTSHSRHPKMPWKGTGGSFWNSQFNMLRCLSPVSPDF